MVLELGIAPRTFRASTERSTIWAIQAYFMGWTTRIELISQGSQPCILTVRRYPPYLATPMGLEPMTFGLTSRYSDHWTTEPYVSAFNGKVTCIRLHNHLDVKAEKSSFPVVSLGKFGNWKESNLLSFFNITTASRFPQNGPPPRYCPEHPRIKSSVPYFLASGGYY